MFSITAVVFILHFMIPFLVNMIYYVPIIILLSRERASVQRKNTRTDDLRVQFQEHKHLLVLPRLTFSFLSGCIRKFIS